MGDQSTQRMVRLWPPTSLAIQITDEMESDDDGEGEDSDDADEELLSENPMCQILMVLSLEQVARIEG